MFKQLSCALGLGAALVVSTPAMAVGEPIDAGDVTISGYWEWSSHYSVEQNGMDEGWQYQLNPEVVPDGLAFSIQPQATASGWSGYVQHGGIDVALDSFNFEAKAGKLITGYRLTVEGVSRTQGPAQASLAVNLLASGLSSTLTGGDTRSLLTPGGSAQAFSLSVTLPVDDSLGSSYHYVQGTVHVDLLGIYGYTCNAYNEWGSCVGGTANIGEAWAQVTALRLEALTAPVPEPSPGWLMGVGLMVVALRARRAGQGAGRG